MGELSKLETRTPIEIALDIDSDGMTTARKLYAFLELAPQHYARWLKSNILGNEFAIENEDYFHSPLMVSEQAREYFTTIEERVKQKSIDRTQLSPQLQALYGLIETQARQELEQKRQAEQITKVEQTVDNMKEIFTQPIGDWKSEINSRVREISLKSNIEYATLYNHLYAELETTAHCSLKRLQENKKKRMEKAGNTKTAIRQETTKIAIIYEKPQLKAIFENIVKKYAMRYCA